jgi:Bacterial Ig-like domain (group 3)/Divergent InlB B-repeat domain
MTTKTPTARRSVARIAMTVLFGCLLFGGAAREASAQTVLQGTVGDRSTGLPLVGVQIKACSSCDLLTMTDGNGQYSLTATQLGNSATGTLLLQKPGYFVLQASFAITTSPTTLDLTLLPGGTLVQGTITDANTSVPIAGAEVGVSVSCGLSPNCGSVATTDVTGHYAMDSSQFFEGAASGFTVSQWILFAPGYFTFTGSSFPVTIPFPTTQNGQMTPTGTTSQITIATVPANLAITVDGSPYVAPQTFAWTPSNPHSFGTSTPQSATPGVQYIFQNWSNGGAISQTIAAPASNTNYTASFATQYLLTTAANSPTGGTITAGGWVNASSNVLITATPASGFVFTGFSGDLSGTANPQYLFANSPKNVVANFIPFSPVTMTTIGSTANPSAWGQTVALTAMVNASTGTPTGNVVFKDGAVTLGTVALTGNSVSLMTSGLSVGSHSITANYLGDAIYNASSSSVLSQAVSRATTTVVVTPSANPGFINQTVTYTATVSGAFGGSPTGTVTFKSGATTLGTATVSGGQGSINKAFPSAGTKPITATYSGDANFTGTTAAALSEIITKYSTSTAMVPSVNPSTYGQPLTFTTTVSSTFGTPAGTVTFKNGTTALGTATLVGGVATFTTSTPGVGSKSITAVYNGNTTFAASNSTAVQQTVTKATTTVVLVSSLNPSTLGQTVTFTATVLPQFSGVPTGSVTFRDGAKSLKIVALSGGTATFATSTLGSGMHNITATYNGNANFTTSASGMTQTVN